MLDKAIELIVTGLIFPIAIEVWKERRSRVSEESASRPQALHRLPSHSETASSHSEAVWWPGILLCGALSLLAGGFVLANKNHWKPSSDMVTDLTFSDWLIYWITVTVVWVGSRFFLEPEPSFHSIVRLLVAILSGDFLGCIIVSTLHPELASATSLESAVSFEILPRDGLVILATIIGIWFILFKFDPMKSPELVSLAK